MIILADDLKPNRMSIDLLDFGITQRGAATLRVQRPGSRYRVTLSWPREVMRPPASQTLIAALKRAKRQGLKIDLLLLTPQGSPGSPVVNGANQSGTTLNVRGFAPGYVAGADYWMTIVDADGSAYLHSVFQSVTANGAGLASVQIEPPLRTPFPDGAAIEMQQPFVQGQLVGETFSYAFEELKQASISITIEEYQ